MSYDAHPEWFFKMADGQPAIYNGLYLACINGGWYRQKAIEILTEALDRYDVDGCFFNNFSNPATDYSERLSGFATAITANGSIANASIAKCLGNPGRRLPGLSARCQRSMSSPSAPCSRASAQSRARRHICRNWRHRLRRSKYSGAPSASTLALFRRRQLQSVEKQLSR